MLAPYISSVIEENFLSGCTLYEPYAGGASVSLELLRLGFVSKAELVERDPLVYAFWRAALEETEALCHAIEQCPITIETWISLQAARKVTDPASAGYSILELGMAGLFFNRTNFSGIIGAGPIGGENQSSDYKIDCRFNKVTTIRQIRAIAEYADRIKVHFGDALKFLSQQAEVISTGFSFVYVDPPYYVQGKKLYRHSYEDLDHQNLASFIRKQGYPWMVSYDDHPRIRELYVDNTVQPLYLDYKVRSNRTARELLISNLIIPPPIYTGTANVEQLQMFS